MARFLRDLLRIPKPKGSDDLAPDDPPWPDVKVVVIVNKRSGSRAVGEERRLKLRHRVVSFFFTHESW